MPILPINIKANASLLDYDPLELARQMTLLDHELLADAVGGRLAAVIGAPTLKEDAAAGP